MLLLTHGCFAPLTPSLPGLPQLPGGGSGSPRVRVPAGALTRGGVFLSLPGYPIPHPRPSPLGWPESFCSCWGRSQKLRLTVKCSARLLRAAHRPAPAAKRRLAARADVGTAFAPANGSSFKSICFVFSALFKETVSQIGGATLKCSGALPRNKPLCKC